VEHRKKEEEIVNVNAANLSIDGKIRLMKRQISEPCESLGITKQTFSCQHKSHINKVMGHGTVGYCFQGDPELGGEGFLLGLHRCQSYKVMLRKVNEQTASKNASKINISRFFGLFMFKNRAYSY
jgi:hypothetical protein